MGISCGEDVIASAVSSLTRSIEIPNLSNIAIAVLGEGWVIFDILDRANSM